MCNITVVKPFFYMLSMWVQCVSYQVVIDCKWFTPLKTEKVVLKNPHCCTYHSSLPTSTESFIITYLALLWFLLFSLKSIQWLLCTSQKQRYITTTNKTNMNQEQAFPQWAAASACHCLFIASEWDREQLQKMFTQALTHSSIPPSIYVSV